MKKCPFSTETVDYLGHVIRPGKLEVAFHTTAAIDGLKHPTKVTELRYLLGLCNVFPSFVPNFAIIASPLTKKLEG